MTWIMPSSRLVRRVAAVTFLTLVLACLLAQGADAATHITTDIKANTTWTTGGSPYLLDKQVKVLSGVTLTLQPGVTVEFNSGQTLIFVVEGTIKAIGTEANPIVFTSVQAAANEGVPGQYKGISLSSGAGAEFSYTHFEYGGYGSGGYYAAGELTVQGAASLKVDHSIFQHNQYAGLKLAGTGVTEVSHSRFEENGDGVSQSANAPGAFSLTHSWLNNNVEDGLYSNFLKTSTFTGAVIENNEISKNGHVGVDIQAYCESPTADFPHGHGNDIFANGNESDGDELATFYPCKALSVDWTSNYWGNVDFISAREPLLLKGFICELTWPKEWYEAATDQSLGYLAYSAYETNALNPPPGPISTSIAAVLDEPMICPDKSIEFYKVKQMHNSFYLAPGEISESPIPIE